MLTLKKAKSIAKTYGFSSLVTLPNGNSKLAKSTGFFNCGISLAQAKLSGFNMCSGSSVGCRNTCLATNSGRAEFTPSIVQIRINRTKLLASNHSLFWSILEPELRMVDRKAKKQGLQVAFRPDMYSDWLWHRKLPQLFTEFPNWKFYGYTKNKAKIRDYLDGKTPTNYYLTYSRSERDDLNGIKQLLGFGINVAIPFYSLETLAGCIPNHWQGLPVIDGDRSDLRFQDPQGVIVGLSVKTSKSRRKAIRQIENSNGFFVGV